MAAAESILNTWTLDFHCYSVYKKGTRGRSSKTNIWAQNQKERKSKEGILI